MFMTNFADPSGSPRRFSAKSTRRSKRLCSYDVGIRNALIKNHGLNPVLPGTVARITLTP